MELKQEQEPYIRLVVCRNCRTIDELPPFVGNPADDVLLELTVEKHKDHIGIMYNVGALHWHSKTMKEAIIKQIQDGASPGLDIFGTGFYETRMTFAEDAMACYKKYNRPKAGCVDFRTEKKRLLPGTDAERKEVGLGKSKDAGGPRVYLCDFCPVRVHYEHKKNQAQGLDA